jgi:hypothetical protein
MNPDDFLEHRPARTAEDLGMSRAICEAVRELKARNPDCRHFCPDYSDPRRIVIRAVRPDTTVADEEWLAR